MTKEIRIGDTLISPGKKKVINIPIAKLYDYTELQMPVKVVRGKKEGPILFVCAAIHGDEINGVEIIKRLLNHSALKSIKGTLVAVPIVNVFGFNSQSRYLPDRRDLNRSFPGSENGSLASRIANIFMKEIAEKCDVGIDLHTGSLHRKNLPQIRACLDDPKVKELAYKFGVPVIIDSKLRDGSLRMALYDKQIPSLLFEAGEAMRFDEISIRSGLHGILSVMEAMGMFEKKVVKIKKNTPYIASSSHWIRAPQSGTLRMMKKLGSRVNPGNTVGVISNPFGMDRVKVKADREGIIIGQTESPLINRGDALFHVATFDRIDSAQESIEDFDEHYDEL